MISSGVGARILLLLGCLLTGAAAATTAVGAGLEVRVSPLSGSPYPAELLDISDAGVTLAVDGQPRTVPRTELSRIERSRPASVQGPSLSVALTDGSRLKCEGMTIEGSEATIQLRRQEELTLPVRKLRWIRFRAPSPTVDDAWLGLLGDERAEDLLVIRRSSDTIDQVNGVVLGADATTVRFSVGNQEVPAPVAKLEGIVFSNTQGTEKSDAIRISVHDTLGSQWSVVSLDIDAAESGSPEGGAAQELRMKLAGGQERLLPLDQIDSIRFEGNLQWLALESPIGSQYTPLIALPLAEERLVRWLGPRSAGERDLVLRSRSSVTFRVDPKFNTFASRIAPDATVAAGGGCNVRILVDGEVVWSETILPADAPRGVELELGEAGRITLEVDYGEGQGSSDAGDVIRFIDPRLLP